MSSTVLANEAWLGGGELGGGLELPLPQAHHDNATDITTVEIGIPRTRG